METRVGEVRIIEAAKLSNSAGKSLESNSNQPDAVSVDTHRP